MLRQLHCGGVTKEFKRGAVSAGASGAAGGGAAAASANDMRNL